MYVGGAYLKPIHPHVNVHDVNVHVNSLKRNTHHQFSCDVALRWRLSFLLAYRQIPPSLPSISLRALYSVNYNTQRNTAISYHSPFFLLP